MDEADFVPLSALQHYAYCPRQCALIHLEQIWEENSHTAEGRLMHERAHSGESTARGQVRLVTDLPLRSASLGVSGKADVVEFRRCGNTWQPYPVEYKKGSPHGHAEADAVQVCAQALCLEEMLSVEIPEAAIFYGSPRRRSVVPLTPDLRRKSAAIALAVHELFRNDKTPLPVERGHCAACSLQNACMPACVEKPALAAHYLESLWSEP